MEKLAKIDASPEAKGVERDLRAELPRTVSDFEVLLTRYQKQNPEQYEKKLANGTFEKQAKALGIAWENRDTKQVEDEVKARSKSKAKTEDETEVKAEEK